METELKIKNMGTESKSCHNWHVCTELITIEPQYHLMRESYAMAKELFTKGRNNYDELKTRSLRAIDLFLDAVIIINEEMAGEVRDAIIRFTKVEGLKGFDDGVMSVAEVVDIAKHCLQEPFAKANEIRPQFHHLVKNFHDVRTFDRVATCRRSLPDEVAAAHCVLHQAVLFNETMQENLISVIEIKTLQYVREMNHTLFGVEACFLSFIPHFFEQTLLLVYTRQSGSMMVLDAVVEDFLRDRWRDEDSKFLAKWSPVVHVLNARYRPSLKQQKHSYRSLDDNRSLSLYLKDFMENNSRRDSAHN